MQKAPAWNSSTSAPQAPDLAGRETAGAVERGPDLQDSEEREFTAMWKLERSDAAT